MAQVYWAPLIVTCAIAAVSTLVGFLLYRYSEAVVERRSVRLSGAAALACVMYIVMAGFYLRLSESMPGIAAAAPLRRALTDSMREFDTCAEQERTFQCQEPAEALRESCYNLLQL